MALISADATQQEILGPLLNDTHKVIPRSKMRQPLGNVFHSVSAFDSTYWANFHGAYWISIDCRLSSPSVCGLSTERCELTCPSTLGAGPLILHVTRHYSAGSSKQSKHWKPVHTVIQPPCIYVDDRLYCYWMAFSKVFNFHADFCVATFEKKLNTIKLYGSSCIIFDTFYPVRLYALLCPPFRRYSTEIRFRLESFPKQGFGLSAHRGWLCDQICCVAKHWSRLLELKDSYHKRASYQPPLVKFILQCSTWSDAIGFQELYLYTHQEDEGALY